jgi:hypothetical protein
VEFFTKPRKPIPEVAGIVDSITEEQYQRLVELVVMDKGCLWPGVIAETNRYDYEPSIEELLQILANNSKSRNAIDTFEENLYFLSKEEQYVKFRTLYQSGCDETYLLYLMNHCNIEDFDSKMMLLEFWEFSKDIKERVPYFILKEKRDRRTKYDLKTKMYIKDYYKNWQKYFFKKPTKENLIQFIKQTHKLTLDIRGLNSILYNM